MPDAKKWCSTHMRDILIEHLDGVKVEMGRAVSNGLDVIEMQHRMNTFKALLARGLIKRDGRSNQHTTLTNAGREALCMILGDWADALRRSGYSVTPLQRGAVRDMRREQLDLRVALIAGESLNRAKPNDDIAIAYQST